MASDSTQLLTSGWATAIAARHRTITHRITAAAAAALVTAPIIGILPVLGWLISYLFILSLERFVVRPDLSDDHRGPKGLKGVLCYAILFTSATTFAWIVLPLWFVAGIYGGVCAVLYLAAGMVQSVTHGAASLRVTIVTATPVAVALCSTPLMLKQVGAGNDAIIAVTTACLVFMGICFVAARRLYGSDRAQRKAFALAKAKRAEAEAAVTARTTLLATIAHDLRTPITAILTGVDTLKDDTSGANRQQLSMIADAGRMMNSLLNDLLDQARINAGRLTLSEQPFDLRRMIAQTVRLWQPAIRAKGLKLRLETTPDLPRTLLGDEIRLRQVLNNLMSNALKFTETGRITLRCGAFLNESGDYALTLELEDTGLGMDEAQLSRLFIPFEQVGDDSVSRSAGSGLGLSICRDLMRLMDGRLTARSRKGEGTIFTVALTLPISDEAPVDLAQASRATPFIPSLASAAQIAPVVPVVPVLETFAASDYKPAHVNEDTPSTFEQAPPAQTATEPDTSSVNEEAPLSILIVDDHEINRRAIQLILQPFDCNITMAADGRTALELASHTPFDVIFMDVRMPELDGRETTRRMRKAGGVNADTPVIAVTADNAPEDQLACAAAGMTSYLAKPLTPSALIATLQATLEKSERHQAAA